LFNFIFIIISLDIIRFIILQILPHNNSHNQSADEIQHTCEGHRSSYLQICYYQINDFTATPVGEKLKEKTGKRDHDGAPHDPLSLTDDEREADKPDIFTVRLNERERETLDACKPLIQQTKDSTA
jgi:hypothetical protein